MGDFQLFWGELHNHCELGYGQGSLERSYDIARSHLDFFALTPHGMVAGSLEAYPIVKETWPAIQRAAAENNRPGEFTCFLGYEWHSGTWGDVHVLYPGDGGALHYEPTLAKLQHHFRSQQALLIPHHIAYVNGVDWELFDAELSPVVEIYSEHGCSERDTGLHAMLGHSGGPGDGRFTAQHGLALGRQFGFAAGTDNHDGHPGGYGLGLTGVWAEQNTREAVFEGLRARRTVAVTGDRVSIDFRADEAPMGSVVSGAEEIRFDVEAWDFIKMTELVRDGEPVLAQTGAPDRPTSEGKTRYRVRLEWGWGPMKGYQVFDWCGQVRIVDGSLEQVMPAFASDPFDERRRKRVTAQDGASCAWTSHTSRGGIFTTRNGHPSCRANDALCLEIAGNADTRIELEIGCETHTSVLATAPDWSLTPRLGRTQQTFRLGELLGGRRGIRGNDIPGSIVVHRAVPQAQYTMEGRYADPAPGCYYLRVTQENGQMAWASPIWIQS